MELEITSKISAAQLAEEVVARCKRLATFSEDLNSTRRTFLSPPMHDVHREVAKWLEPTGAEVQVDAAGNLRALYLAEEESSPRLLIGSHLDTVPNAGAYDGILGVALAAALLQALDGRRFCYAIEVVGFSDEEGVRFGTPFIGSRALVGRLDAKLLNTEDAHGISVRKAIETFGLDPDEIPQACIHDAFGYLEFHIEQGPVLDRLGLPLAVVDAIAGQSRLELRFLGQANHAGTTPMAMRFDALAGAAEWITMVEREANATPGLVATVGSVESKPGATNVIAGEARVSLDVRHREDDLRLHAAQKLVDLAQRIARQRRLSISCNILASQPAVRMDPILNNQIEKAMRKAGCEPHRMVSGAGHDAMIVAEKIPAAMIFLRTPNGISHDPAESVEVKDVEKVITCGLHLFDELNSSIATLTGTRRA